MMSPPTFSFHANSAEPDDKSGVATWRCHEIDDTTCCRQRFDSFAEASAINDVVRCAFDAGVRFAERQVCASIDNALREYRW